MHITKKTIYNRYSDQVCLIVNICFKIVVLEQIGKLASAQWKHLILSVNYLFEKNQGNEIWGSSFQWRVYGQDWLPV